MGGAVKVDMTDNVRLLLATPRSRDRSSIMLVLVLILPLLSPAMVVDAAQVKAEDFGIVAELHEVLATRDILLDSEEVRLRAEDALAPVRSGVRSMGTGDPLTYVDSALDGLDTEPSEPQAVDHPPPIDLLIGDDAPPGYVDTIWGTMINLTDYVIWVQYQAVNDGPSHERYTTITFSSSLLSLFSQEPLLHEIDVDGDGDDYPDIRVGITITFDLSNGWGVEGTPPSQLWLEPTIEFRVEVIDPTAELWRDMETLEVSLMKSFAYGINPLQSGESYVWIIDSHFTIAPTDWALQVGFERFWFDLGDVGLSFIAAILSVLDPVIPDQAGPDESAITIAALAAPYSIQIDNAGQTHCPTRYDPVDHLNESKEHGCRIAAGFGYGHFAPEQDGVRDLWELSYLEVALHPIAGSERLPSIADVTIRDDSILPSGAGTMGEDGLTTLEYYADERADIWFHFYEDRRNYTEGAGEPFGNVTESVGWLRGMPSGTLSPLEIERCFQMLGSASQPELPGQLPSRLSFILGIKNFSRDDTPNVDDPTLPINPRNPPNTLVLLRSTQSVAAVDYVSWFMREGAETDHRKTGIQLENLPTGLILYGDFFLGGGDELTVEDQDANLDILSQMLDVTILTVVDIFMDVSNIINSIPNALVDVISGSTGDASQGTEIHIEMFTHFEVGRQPMPIGVFGLVMGSSVIPIAYGPHLILADDRTSPTVQGRHGEVDKLVPISISLYHEGLQSLHIVDNATSQSQRIAFGAVGGDPLRILFLEHQGGDLASSDFQSIRLSEQPATLELDVSLTELTFSADRDIPEIIYIGKEGNQRQALVIEHLPGNFTMAVDADVTWVSQSPIGSVSLMISNASDPKTMDGDHFLFIQDKNAGEATLSTRIHGITEVGYLGAEVPGDPGEAGRGQGFLVGPGDGAFHGVIMDQTEYESEADGLTAFVLLDPLPAQLALQVPQGGVNQTSPLDVPEFTTDEGLAGIAFFLAGFTDFGQSVNGMLGDLVTSVTGGAIDEQRSNFSFGIELDAGQGFDLVIDAQQGRMPLDEPEWLHGISIEAGNSADNHTAFRARVWMPDLAPIIDLSIGYENLNITDLWDISIELEGWKPANPEFMIEVNGYNGRDLHLMLLGFEPGESTDIAIETQITTDYRPVVPQMSMFSNYQMSVELDAVHATLLDRTRSTRYELLLQGIPKQLDMTASLGSMVSVGMEANDPGEDGLSIDSLMLQMNRFSVGKWWPATVFLHELPSEMNLTTAPSTVFDITKPLGFQGMATLTYSSSAPGMDLFISTTGRAVEARGDTLLLAENLASHMSIEPTTDFGMRISSSGEGIGRLYLRQNDVPAQPGVWLHQLEAAGENLKSATIQIHQYGPYPVIAIDDVRGGRIIANARVDIEVAGQTLDGRAVLIDAQATGGIPTGTTVGVNGLAADLSLLNLMGFEGETTHYLMPEPLTTAIVTGVATLLGD